MKRKREFNSRKPLKIKTILYNSYILQWYFSKKFLNQNCEKLYKIYSKISLENHEFINVPYTISRNLSLINYEISTLFKSLNLYNK